MTLSMYKKERDRAVAWETGTPAVAADSGAEAAFWSVFQEMEHVAASNSDEINRAEYFDEIIGKVRDATGETLQNPMNFSKYRAQNYDDAGNPVYMRDVELNKFRARIDQIGKDRPDLRFDVSEQGLAAASQRIGQRYDEQAKRDQLSRSNAPWTTTAAGFLGGAAAGMKDPINIVSMALTLPFGAAAGVGRAAVVGAASGGLSQTAITGLNYDYRRQIDPSYTYQSAVEEIAMASFGGLVLEGGGALLAKGARAARNRFTQPGTPAAPAPAPAASAAAPAPAQAALAQQAAPAKPAPKSRKRKDAEAIVSRENLLTNPKPPGTPDTPAAQATHTAAAKLAAQQMEAGERVDVSSILGSQPSGRQGRVMDPSGREIGVSYEVVDARRLISSHNDDLAVDPRFPPELQPRDRSRAASQDQINAIAADLRPEWLGVSPRSDSGAPIVGPDGIVESGNGRVLALRRAYSRNGPQAAAYRQYLVDQGFDVGNVEQPVLVARRTTELSKAEREGFVHSSNTATVARMGAGEQALADARLLTPDMVAVLDQHGPYSAEFARKIFAELPAEERGNLVMEGGVLSADGIRRINGMMLGRAYGDAKLLGRALEDPDSNIKAIAGALTDVAPKWTVLRDGVATGRVEASMDITKDLLDAVKMVMRARDEGIKLADLMKQNEMFGGPSEFSKIIARNFFNNGDMARQVSQAKIAKFLKDFATEADKVQAGPRLFGEALKPDDVMTTALKNADRPDLIDLVEAKTTAEAAEAAAQKNAAEIEDQILMEANRMMADNPGLKVKIMEDGKEVEKGLFEAFQELDAEIEAAKTIDLCIVGKPAAETAE